MNYLVIASFNNSLSTHDSPAITMWPSASTVGTWYLFKTSVIVSCFSKTHSIGFHLCSLAKTIVIPHPTFCQLSEERCYFVLMNSHLKLLFKIHSYTLWLSHKENTGILKIVSIALSNSLCKISYTYLSSVQLTAMTLNLYSHLPALPSWCYHECSVHSEMSLLFVCEKCTELESETEKQFVFISSPVIYYL